jgi:hypothetical protein
MHWLNSNLTNPGTDAALSVAFVVLYVLYLITKT